MATTPDIDSDDPYKVLGVDRDCDVVGIHKAFKKLALKYHPDKNRDNEAQATANFRKISAAFEKAAAGCCCSGPKQERYSRYSSMVEALSYLRSCFGKGDPCEEEVFAYLEQRVTEYKAAKAEAEAAATEAEASPAAQAEAVPAAAAEAARPGPEADQQDEAAAENAREGNCRKRQLQTMPENARECRMQEKAAAAEKAFAEKEAARQWRNRWSRKGRKLHAAAEEAALQQAVANKAEAEAAATEAEASPAAQAEAVPAAAAEAESEAAPAEAEAVPAAESEAAPAAEAEEAPAAEADVDLQNKKSRVQNISWHAQKKAWQVQWSEDGKRQNLHFSQSVYTKHGMSSDEGCLAAFKAAKALRQEKAGKGLMKAHDAQKHEVSIRKAASGMITKERVGKGRKAKFKGKALPQSSVRNIFWVKHHCHFKVQPKIRGKPVFVGNFTPRNASAKEIKRARLEALECLRAAQRKHGLPEA